MTVAGVRGWNIPYEKMATQVESLTAAGVEHTFIAVNTAQDKIGMVDMTFPNATVFGVQPWGKFTAGLNGILTMARPYLAAGHNMLFLSAEVRVSQEGLAKLESLMGPETLCVGAALEGHRWEPGFHPNASGRQWPWNTLAEWNGSVLGVTGFPMGGEGPLGEPENAGVEEVITGAILHILYPSLRSYLTTIPGQASWEVSGFDAERRAAHEKKMFGKDSRPARQLEVAHLEAPPVWHV